MPSNMCSHSMPAIPIELNILEMGGHFVCKHGAMDEMFFTSIIQFSLADILACVKLVDLKEISFKLMNFDLDMNQLSPIDILR